MEKVTYEIYKELINDIHSNIEDQDEANNITDKLDKLVNRFDALVTKSCSSNGVVAEKFNAIHLWNQAAEFSGNVHLTNGYWRALKDLEQLNVIVIDGIEPD